MSSEACWLEAFDLATCDLEGIAALLHYELGVEGLSAMDVGCCLVQDAAAPLDFVPHSWAIWRLAALGVAVTRSREVSIFLCKDQSVQ